MVDSPSEIRCFHLGLRSQPLQGELLALKSFDILTKASVPLRHRPIQVTAGPVVYDWLMFLSEFLFGDHVL